MPITYKDPGKQAYACRAFTTTQFSMAHFHTVGPSPNGESTPFDRK